MKTLLFLIISGALVVSGFGQTRNVLVGTNNAVVQPTNFWSADASNARTGLGLGSAATNPASAFQPSSLNLTNLSANNGGGLTNLTASSVVGTLSLSQGGTGATNAAGARNVLQLGTAATNDVSAFQPSSLALSNLASGNGGGLTNLQASNLIGTINVSNVPVVTLTNISGTLAVAKGGTGSTNASEARQNLGATTVGNAVFVATNAETARTAINALAPNGNAASLTNFPALLLRTNGDGSGITNISGANVVGAVASASNITGIIAISNVSNLQSSLDGKLGTNPTLAIANISNLQTTLDGKLGTNPTLQISNIAALQTALDGKLSGTFPIAISNVSGLQTSLDGKLGTNPTLAIANITGLQTNLDSKLSLTGNAANLTNFPASLLRTTGNASGLTNFPTLNQNTTGTASNVTGVVAVANGGTGTNSATGARLNLGLVWSGLTNTNAETFRTALGLGSLSTLSAAAISNVTGLQTALDAKLASNGNAINLTNFPTSLLRVDGSAAVLTNFPAILLRTNGDAGGLTNFPTLNQNTTGTASNVTGVVAVSNGGTGATNAANARTALGLGTASTNPATAFQASSTVLSNLAISNGGALTNIASTNIVGTVALASNITGTAPLATNVTGVVALANGGTGATNQSGARTALGVGASDVFVGLTNLGTGAGQGFSSSPYILGSTNSTTPNNAVLALNAAGVRSVASLTLAALTNTDNSAFRAAIGLGSAATNAATAFQPASTVLSNLALSNGATLTNISVTGVVGALATNGDAINLTNFPTSLLRVDGNATALTNFPSLLLRTNGNGAGLTNLTAANITGTVGLASNVTGTIAISNGGSGATTAGGARTNLGLGAPWLTNTVASNFRTAIGLGASDVAFFGGLDVSGSGIEANNILLSGSNGVLAFEEESAKAQTRTNLGLGWPALTSTTASGFQAALFGTNTNPVLVNTNGEVVSPTNFWQAAPITTTFIESQPVTNFTTNITPARFLHIHSLATNIANVTNTIVLPTNTLTFEGDVAIVVHKGPTNSMTRVQRAGSTNNLITLTRFDEAVQFVYYNDVWQFDHNVAFVEPIYFAGTNAAANAATSRTNLGLGESSDPRFAEIRIGDTNISFESTIEDEGINWYFNRGTNASQPAITIGYLSNSILSFLPVQFQSNSHAATTRTNLGLGLPALTNTNAAKFQEAIFTTNAAPTNSANVNTVNFNTAVSWMAVNIVTNGVTNTFHVPLFK